jgi:MSHA pilin protein MshA
MHKSQKEFGFTIVELVIIIVIISILAAIAIPRFLDLSSNAKIATLENIAGNMRSIISIVKANAYANGFTKSTSDPIDQSSYLIETEIGTTEIDWRNFCPESIAELGDT